MNQHPLLQNGQMNGFFDDLKAQVSSEWDKVKSQAAAQLETEKAKVITQGIAQAKTAATNLIQQQVSKITSDPGAQAALKAKADSAITSKVSEYITPWVEKATANPVRTGMIALGALVGVGVILTLVMKGATAGIIKKSNPKRKTRKKRK